MFRKGCMALGRCRLYAALCLLFFASPFAMAAGGRGQLFGGNVLKPSDFGKIEVTINYDPPLKYVVTAELSISEMVQGLNDCRDPVDGIEEKTRHGRVITLLLVGRENGLHERQEAPACPAPAPVVLRLNVNEELLSAGEPALAPSPRLQGIWEIIWMRLTGQLNPPADDTSLLGGFSIHDLQWPERAGDTELTPRIIQAITDFCSEAPSLSPAQKQDWRWVTLYALRVAGAEKHGDHLVANVEDFIRRAESDQERAPEYGGLPFGTMVQITAHHSLGCFFERTHRYQEAMAEMTKVRDLLTDEVIQMAADAPSELPDYVYNPTAPRRYLVWFKDTGYLGLMEQYKQKVSQEN